MHAQRKYNTSIRRENAYKKKNHLQSEGDVYVKVSATDEKKINSFLPREKHSLMDMHSFAYFPLHLDWRLSDI